MFATVQHQIVRSKGRLSHRTARAMLLRLVIAGSKTWRRLNGCEQLPRVIRLTDGTQADETPVLVAA